MINPRINPTTVPYLLVPSENLDCGVLHGCFIISMYTDQPNKARRVEGDAVHQGVRQERRQGVCQGARQRSRGVTQGRLENLHSQGEPVLSRDADAKPSEPAQARRVAPEELRSYEIHAAAREASRVAEDHDGAQQGNDEGEIHVHIWVIGFM